LEGKQQNSVREGFPYWMNDTLYGVKWQNFKMVQYLQKTLTEPSLKLMTPHLINLTVDPKERNPYNFPFLHSWVLNHTVKIVEEFEESVRREPLIPAFAPLNYVPRRSPG
jgi:arylsulfatase